MLVFENARPDDAKIMSKDPTAKSVAEPGSLEGCTREPRPCWRYVRLRELESLKPSPKETVRKSFFGLFHRFRERSKPGNVEGIHDKLERLPDWRMDRVAPAPNWQELAPALDRVLKSWAENRSGGSRLEVVVGAPYSGTTEALSHWVGLRGVMTLEPPSPAEILNGAEAWLQHSLAGDAGLALAIPRLS
jgi:hypothetical protein